MNLVSSYLMHVFYIHTKEMMYYTPVKQLHFTVYLHGCSLFYALQEIPYVPNPSIILQFSEFQHRTTFSTEDGAIPYASYLPATDVTSNEMGTPTCASESCIRLPASEIGCASPSGICGSRCTAPFTRAALQLCIRGRSIQARSPRYLERCSLS